MIFGRAQEGKSTLCKRVLEAIRKHYAFTVILDPHGEYEGGPVVHNFAEFLEEVQANDPALVLFQVEQIDPDELDRLYKFMYEVRDSLLVIDEAEMFVPKTTTAKPGTAGYYFHLRVALGAHVERNLGVIAVGRRPVELNVYLRSQFTSLVTFKQTEPNDLARLEDYGFDPEQVVRLDSHKYIVLGLPLPLTDNKQQEAQSERVL